VKVEEIMANIIEQLRSGKADVHHRGYTLKNVNFPSYIPDVAKVLFDKEALVEVLEDNGILLELLHLGISEYVVKWRACVRPTDTNEKPKEIADERDDAMKRGRFFKPNLLPNPDEVKASKGVSRAVAEHSRKLVISMAQVEVPWEQVEKALEKSGVDPVDYADIYERALEG
jgi:hypothetical protein